MKELQNMYNILLLFQTRFETVFLNSLQISSFQKTEKLLEEVSEEHRRRTCNYIVIY